VRIPKRGFTGRPQRAFIVHRAKQRHAIVTFAVDPSRVMLGWL
jgi:hypothetical protein